MKTDQQNIVWITLDSLRYDHTSMSGYKRDTTPNINQIAEEDGISLSACFSHAEYSGPSIPSILSGTYPSNHQTFYRNTNKFPNGLPLIQEILNDIGYYSIGISNNAYASSLTGVNRGFDDFTLLGSKPLDIYRSVGFKNLLSYILNIRNHSAGLTTDMHAHSGGYLINRLAEQEMLASEQPFFCYIHYNQTHRAYYPPLSYIEEFVDEISYDAKEAASISMNIHRNLSDIVSEGLDIDPSELDALIAMYDSEIAYTDKLVGDLVELIDRNLNNTIVIITADHGEVLGENNNLAHKGAIHNAVYNVPMVIKGIPDISDEEIIQHSDVVRTLLEVVGGETSTIRGIDLRNDSREYAISQVGGSDCLIIQNQNYKYVDSKKNPQLYELPGEEKNVIQSKKDKAKEMKNKLDEWFNTEGQPVKYGSDAKMDNKTRSRLRDLGYLND